MTKVMHARSRGAAVVGLVLQVAALVVVLVLAYTTAGPKVPFTHALFHLAGYFLAGVPIWLAAVLYFRQRELAELEAIDLAELKREKEATGGGTAIFDEEGAGFRVAQARLEWIERWLVPTFGLLTGLLMTAAGAWALWQLTRAGLSLGRSTNAMQAWGEVINQPIAMIVLAIVVLVSFLFSRYASGMGRVEQWQMLRGCGSYLLGNTLLTIAAVIGLGVDVYANTAYVLHILAYVIPAVLIILGVETLLNFVADIYRPRKPGVERRASFDSRLLGLISEPGGIAHSIAEAMNYQFGFEVSKTWFYQLLQRAAAPLVSVGLLLLWLLTAFVTVDVDEHAIVERFGRQVNAENPWGPGWHMKWPWPFEVVHKFNTGNVRQMYIGFSEYAAEPTSEELSHTGVVQWTDAKHLNREHFDFLCPLTPKQADRISDAEPEDGASQLVDDYALLTDEDEAIVAVPVNSLRMDVVVQYRIRPGQLAAYTQQSGAAEQTLRHLAWRRTVQYNASHDVEALLGPLQQQIGEDLKQRLQGDVDRLNLGLEVVYIGLHNLHPETTVAEAYRGVVNAEQEKLGLIREARVEENQMLSEVAGNKTLARRLAYAIDAAGDYTEQLDRSRSALGGDPREVAPTLWDALLEVTPLLVQREQARWSLQRARYAAEQVQQDYEIGLRFTEDDVAAAGEAVAAAEAALDEADARVDAALAPVQQAAGQPQPVVAAATETLEAQVALDFWEYEIEQQLPDLQGSAAVTLAQARASRWRIEMEAASQLSRLQNERLAFRAAPEVFKARQFLITQSNALRNARKFFMAFAPGDRKVHIRYQAEQQAELGLNRIDFTEE